MNRKETLVLVKNAGANVLRGGATAAVALALPAFLTRRMSVDAYGVWALVLQMSAFVSYLDFGIQTAVGRFVAHAGERADLEQRDRVVSTSLAALTTAAAIGIAGAAGLAILMPRIFHQIPHALLGDARLTLLLVAGSMAVGLPFSVFNGIFVGLQRYEVPAAVIGGSRLLSAVLVVGVARHGGNLVQMGVSMAAVNLASYGLQYWLYRKLAPRARFSRRLISHESGKELFDYCLSLSIWSFATLLVTGLDITLVGLFDFPSVAYYAVAATLITFILGVQNAIFTAMIPAAAVLEARDNTTELGSVLLSTTRYGMFLLLGSGVPLLIATRQILSVWVGGDYASRAGVILQVLVVANIIRLSAVPYAMLLIGTGQQRLVIVSPLIEGFSNLLVSAAAGAMYGAIGVAVGTLVGSTIGILCNFIYNMPRSTRIAARRAIYLRDGFLRPLVCASPFLSIWLFRWLSSGWAQAITQASALTLVAIWGIGLSTGEKERLLGWFGLRSSGRAGAHTY